MSYGTQFAETEALLATQVGDETEVQRILSEMTNYELQSLSDTCHKLRSMALEWLACGGVQL